MSNEQSQESPNQGFSAHSPLGPDGKPIGADKKILAGVLGILFGGLGIHKFVLGYTKEGIIMLAATLLDILACGIAALLGILACDMPSYIIMIIGFVEGIIYLTKSDEEFSRLYIQGRKGWF